MVYTFKATTNEKDNFEMVIDCNPDMPLIDLHNFLQKELGFDTSQIASFFLVDENWEKNQEITLLDMSEEDGVSFTMDEIRIKDYINEKDNKLLYVFDFFSDRSLKLELINQDASVALKNHKLKSMEGTPPSQLNDDINNLFDV